MWKQSPRENNVSITTLLLCTTGYNLNLAKMPSVVSCRWLYLSQSQRREAPSGRKPGARITNSARLYIPGKMRTQRSVKSINNRGRVTMFQGWTSHGSQKYGGLSGVERAKIKKIYVRKITQHEENFF